jgi:hypothetical protein
MKVSISDELVGLRQEFGEASFTSLVFHSIEFEGTSEISSITLESNDAATDRHGLKADFVVTQNLISKSFVCIDCDPTSSSLSFDKVHLYSRHQVDSGHIDLSTADNFGYAGCFQRCTFLVSYNPCVTNNGGCHQEAYCESTNLGDPTCTCRPGFTGDGITQCVEDQVKCVHSGLGTKPVAPLTVAARTVAECRAHCKSHGTEIFAMECPAGGLTATAECYCYDTDIWDQVRFSDYEFDALIPFENCEGTPGSSPEINEGSNDVCTGPFVDDDGQALGGFDRAALYMVNPCDPNNNCDQFATCNDEDGVPVCTCNPGYAGDGFRCVTAIVTTIAWEVSDSGFFGFEIYDEFNALTGSRPSTFTDADGSVSFDGFVPHRVAFMTDNADEFEGKITINQHNHEDFVPDIVTVDISDQFRCIDCIDGSQSTTFEFLFIGTVDNTGTTSSSCNTECSFVRSGTTYTKLSWTEDSVDGNIIGGDFGFTMYDLNGNVIYSQEVGTTAVPGEADFYGIVNKVQFHTETGTTDGFNAFTTLTQDAVDITSEFTCVDCPENRDMGRLYVDDSPLDAHVGPTHCELSCEFQRFDICSTCAATGYSYEFGMDLSGTEIRTVGGVATLASCLGHCNANTECVAIKFVPVGALFSDCVLLSDTGVESGDGQTIGARNCELYDPCKTTTVFSLTRDTDISAGGHIGYTLFDKDGVVLFNQAIMFIDFDDSNNVLGVVDEILFESDNIDDFVAFVAISQNGDDVVDDFVCIDCADVTQSTGLNGISLSGDPAISHTLSDGTIAAACSTACTYKRVANPCATANGGCDANAMCSNVDDSAVCTCRAGYTGDGLTCEEDIEKCIQNVSFPPNEGVKTLEECRTYCSDNGDFPIFGMECPQGADTATCFCFALEVWDQSTSIHLSSPIYEDPIIPIGNCLGDPAQSPDINGGSNGACSGPHIDANDEGLGGFQRIMLRYTDPCLPRSDVCDENASCVNNNGAPDCTCNSGFASPNLDGLTCIASVVTTISWSGSSGTGVFGVDLYDSDNLLFLSDPPVARAADGSISFDGFEPVRIVFNTDTSDDFFASISVEQDGTDVTSLFTCIDCATGTQSTAINVIYLDDVANTGSAAAACEGDCEFVRAGTTVTALSWVIGSEEGGTSGELGVTFFDADNRVLYAQSEDTSYPGDIKFIGILETVMFSAGTGSAALFGADFSLSQNGVDILSEFRCTDCAEAVEPDLTEFVLSDDTSGSSGLTRCDNLCLFKRFDEGSSCRGLGYTTESGTEYLGNDIRIETNVATFENCLGQCDVEAACVAVRYVGTDCTLKDAVVDRALGTRDGSGISGRKCSLVNNYATTSTFSWTEDDVDLAGGVAGFTLYDADGNVLHAKAVEATSGSDSVTVTGEVHQIIFDSGNADTWTVTIGLTQGGIRMNSVFVCIDCHDSSVSTALAGISVGDDSESGTTMTDGSSSAGCAGSCVFLRTSDPCSVSYGGCDAENGICTNLGGTASCACRGGFTGDGVTCTEDVEKCINSGSVSGTRTAGQSVDQCRVLCTASVAFAMECPAGGNTAECFCLDLDTWDSSDNIIPFGNCEGSPNLSPEINSGGNGICSGPHNDGDGNALGGFERAVIRLSDPCLSPESCAADSTCVNNAGTAECTCNQGFIGDGQTCIDINDLYQGCFSDNDLFATGEVPVLRDLEGFESNDQDENWTPPLCATYCESIGYLYASNQRSIWCYCGNSFGRYGTTTPSGTYNAVCDESCLGNLAGESYICGGIFSNSVYRTSNDPHPCLGDPCDINANCIGNFDSATETCECTRGYVGNGYECADNCHQSNLNCKQNLMDTFCETRDGGCSGLPYARFASGTWSCYADLDCIKSDKEACVDENGDGIDCIAGDEAGLKCDFNTELTGIAAGGCDPDLCATANGGCPTDASCTANIGEVYCQCNEGFTPINKLYEGGASDPEFICNDVTEPLFPL